MRVRHDWGVIAAGWEALFLERLGARALAQTPALAASLLLSGARGATEGPAPADPDEAGLLTTLAETLRVVLGSLGQQGRVGVLSADQGQLLGLAQACCRPGGYLLLCVASGAWPLVMPGHLARLHDLRREEILRLLPGRPVCLSFLPRGLVSQGSERFHAGRWLALAPAQGPPPGRPPPELLAEVRRAGLT